MNPSAAVGMCTLAVSEQTFFSPLGDIVLLDCHVDCRAARTPEQRSEAAAAHAARQRKRRYAALVLCCHVMSC